MFPSTIRIQHVRAQGRRSTKVESCTRACHLLSCILSKSIRAQEISRVLEEQSYLESFLGRASVYRNLCWKPPSPPSIQSVSPFRPVLKMYMLQARSTHHTVSLFQPKYSLMIVYTDFSSSHDMDGVFNNEFSYI